MNFCLTVSRAASYRPCILFNPMWTESASVLGRHLPLFVFERTVFKVYYQRGNDTVSHISLSQ
jgi:hypothetical protein